MIASKAAKTSQFIIETVAPYFNKHGYIGTSLSDITKATGLTKGAIYGNFQNKEDLAIKAFNYTVKTRLWPVIEAIEQAASGLDKLRAVTNFYRHYYDHVSDYGGCPVLNVGVDSMNQHSALNQRVLSVIGKMTQGIVEIIQQAQDEGSVRQNIDPQAYAEMIYAQIQGSIFLSILSKSNQNMQMMMDHIDDMIDKELKT
ncbi:TetR/AcrR family transcriptional regulator [Reichenbachiella sp. MSK19-1]|uniref:TetR/AcrR family transcriptional regulator n=1 Tax=Reichenbachiella sp. MSK19-1 TaxID=1897631 RepID=UPI000E6D17B3|nr:TetR/AcrR family transcriptional regulator [Reichenbachiella sp. MSK19-1]RJE74096.1 hypothetical protein BGP76_12940 [Reichenbachiella sp. MSK19-1]